MPIGVGILRTCLRRQFGPAVLLAVAVSVGCSSSARERLKAFFFEIPPEPQAQSFADKPADLPSEPPALSLPESKYVSLHPPYLARQCQNCHDSAHRMQVREDLADSCRGCHARFFGPEVGHPPVAQGQCAECHDMHRSEQLHLLKNTVLKTCVECHDEPADLSKDAHGGPKVEQCTSCHDPHFGSGALLRTSAPPTPK